MTDHSKILSLIVLGLLSASAASAKPAKSTPPALECNAAAFNDAERQRHAQLLDDLRRQVVSTRMLPRGAELSLPPGATVLAQVAEWIALEQRCCPFLAFGVSWKHDDAPIRVRITGPEGTAEMLAGVLREG